jgi:hypothetical protein
MTSADIIARFVQHPKIGTMSGFARLIPAPVSTVGSWKDWNQIPDWRQPRILALAAEYGIHLSTQDFPPPDERVKAA